MSSVLNYQLTIFKKYKKLWYPRTWVIILLFCISTLSLGYYFIVDKTVIWASGCYVISAYTLVVIGCKVPRLYQIIKKIAFKNKYIEKYATDKVFRMKQSMYIGLLFNVVYVIFRLLTAYIYQSVWFLSIGVYFIVLSSIKFTLLKKIEQSLGYKEQLLSYRMTGYFMLLLNVAMSGMIVQMIFNNKGYSYPGYIIYVSALYSFYYLISAMIHVFTFRKENNFILSASRFINLCGAMLSIYALQTAMLSQFGMQQAQFKNTMNMLTGIIIMVLVFLIASTMIVLTNRKLRIEKEESYERRC